MAKLRLGFLVSLLLWVGSAAAAADLADSPCFQCHKIQQKVFSEGTVHSPVAEGDCGSCHKDHGPTNTLILTEKAPKLCLDCHDEVSGAHVHSPVAEGECATCHRPHNSPEKKLLAKAAPALCYECHDDFSTKKSVHAPVADGECMECHAGHKSDREALLTKSYDRERYVDFSEGAYALCFECHEAKSFADLADDSTGFRDGSRNLHYLHSVGRLEAGKYKLEKARKRMSCNGCHLVHGADQEKLVRGSLERGAMTLYTIQFTKTEGGGTCIVGCHKPQEYRQKPDPQVSRGPAASAPDQEGNPGPVKAMN